MSKQNALRGKCICSFDQPLPGGGYRSYKAGVIYPDLSGLDKATIAAYFDTPSIAPPKGMQTRDVKPAAEEVN